MNTIDPIIRFEHVSKKRGNQIILDDVTFAVEKNTLTVIQGFSGIGKTTILSLISGFERIDAGNLYVNHLLVDSHESYIQPNKRHVAMQFQGLALWPHVSALEHILFVMRNPSIDGALDVARRVGFPAKKLYTYPGELSGGERQRLALARTIATPCEIILFDEPFNNLDAHLYQRVTDLIEELSHTKTVIVVTHDVTSNKTVLTPQSRYQLVNCRFVLVDQS